MFRSFLPLILLGAAACDPSDKVAPATDSDGSDDTATVPCGVTYYLDSDADGYGDPSVSTCDEVAPIGYVINDQDCDDSDPATYPGALELCSDGQDQDCDGELDERDWYYTDSDGDGYGDEDSANFVCSPEPGSVSNGSDCDDSNADINPGATEYCDSNDVDENCDGQADGADADGARDWYIDADGDGYGDEDSLVTSCERPDGAIEKGGDCDDDEATAWPGAPEICDGLPNNCEEWDLWTNADEANTVSFVGEDGEVMDLTADVSTTSSDVSELVIQTSGTLRFCADPDTGTTWYVSIEAASIDLTVEGPLGDEHTVLSGGSVSTVMQLDTCVVTLDGLTVQDGYTSGDGGGASVTGVSNVTASDCTFQRNVARGHGGAIWFANGGTLNLSDVTLTENSSGDSGGSIFLYDTVATLERVVITNNEAGQYGGGVYLRTASVLTATDLLVNGNNANNEGGGLFLYAEATSDLGAAVSISGNTAPKGGGVSLGGYDAIMTLSAGAEIVDNEASNGGGVHVHGSELIMEDGATVSGNTATSHGGGVYLYGGNVTLKDGAAVRANYAGKGGGVYLYASTLTLNGAMISTNTATYEGGGLYLYPYSSTTNSNSTMFVCAGASMLSGNTTTAGEGPGAFIGAGEEGALLKGTDCTFEDAVYTLNNDTTYDLSAVTAFTCDVDGCE